MNNKFKELREKNHLTQPELSRKTSISQQTLSRIEVSGRYPNSETLLKIARFYKVSTDYLLGLKEKNDTQNFLIEMYNKMNLDEREDWLKIGNYIISSHHQQ